MQSDEQEIRLLVTKWMTASRTGDIETILDLMTDDVVFLRPGQPPMVGKASFAAAAKTPAGQQPPQIDGAGDIQEVQILGDWAFMWSKLSMVITPPGGGKPMKRAGYTLSVLKKQEDRWVIARDANMLAPVAE